MPVYDAVEMAGNLDDVEVWANEGGFAVGDRVIVTVTTRVRYSGRVERCDGPLVRGGRVAVWVRIDGAAAPMATVVSNLRRCDGPR